ncbi:response regulator [Vibrio sp. JC009]|uniref:HD domain-containing phosphohydrolase n=1 Tax=Vibrio sp. JC009 TaxID=2912314 RepID=UPI0023B04983|nr:HD domain-containing phosphohydrolase [Vibrio sp. JC009]WED20565.1 response regulator [Vibrio sp. JC009]
MAPEEMDELTEKQNLLIVDDTPENIDVLKGILSDEYQVRIATNGQTALKIAKLKKPDLILLDVMMPEIDGHEVCKRLKADEETAAIPIIFVTAMTEVEDETLGLKLGAVDYITKPVNAAIVKARVSNHLALANQRRAIEREVVKRTKELDESHKSAIFMLGEAGHYNDNDTGVHIWRMAAYAGALAKKVNWHVDDAKILELAAPMHDTGKIGIVDSILKAPRKLNIDEWEVMKTHCEIGYKILNRSEAPLFKQAAEIARYHHEKWDGSGYPFGLEGDDIPESARIVALADVFDALTMRRPYKEPWPVEKAFEEIQNSAGSHFEPRLVDAFIEMKDELMAIMEEWNAKEQAEGS